MCGHSKPVSNQKIATPEIELKIPAIAPPQNTEADATTQIDIPDSVTITTTPSKFANFAPTNNTQQRSTRFGNVAKKELSDAEWLAIQDSIVARFGTLHINPLASLAKMPLGAINPQAIAAFPEAGGYVPSHLYTITTGMGLTLAKLHDHHSAKNHTVNLLEPDLLMYAPINREKPTTLLGQGSFTDLIPETDYVLIGWGYYSDYIPGQPPQVEGVNPKDWFVHERGYHLLDGGFDTVEVEEPYRGALASNAPERSEIKPEKTAIGAHGRVWDLHVWRQDLVSGAGQAPVRSIAAPKELAKLLPEETLTLPEDGFFYPEESPEKKEEDALHDPQILTD